MAFTEAEKVKMRLFLGFPDVFQQSNPRLESVFDVIGSRADTETKVREIITAIEAADTKVNNVLAQAGVKRVDEVEFFQSSKGSNAAVDDARRNGRMHVGRLSIILGVPKQGDIFGETGYEGDKWARSGFQYGGNSPNGGMVPLG